MKVSSAERQLLATVHLLHVRPQDWHTGETLAATRDALVRHGTVLFGERLEPWDDAFSSLAGRGLLERRGEVWRLTPAGRPLGEEIQREIFAEGFGDELLRRAASPTYGAFCARVFGRDLSQYSLLDDEQLGHLAAALELAEGDRALDLGCGLGRITGALAAATGARWTGIDLAGAAIRRAAERAPPGVDFRAGDLHRIELTMGAFAAAAAVDTLYFLEDLPAVVRRIAGWLAPAGRLAAFASEVLPKDAGPAAGLDPADTVLGQALAAAGLPFETHDFTRNEVTIWGRQLEVARELEDEFRAEGNGELAEALVRDAERLLAWVDAGRVRRFFYLARKAS